MKTYIQPRTAILTTAPLNLMLGASNHVVKSNVGIQAKGQGLNIQYAI